MKKFYVILTLLFISKFLMAAGEVKMAGPEGTNGAYYVPFDQVSETLGINNPNTITASTGYDLILRNKTSGMLHKIAVDDFKKDLKFSTTYSGTTGAAGTYTVTFPTAYSVAPNVQANIIGATDTQNIRTTAVSTTSVTILVRNRVDVVGLLPTWGNVTGASVDILVTAK